MLNARHHNGNPRPFFPALPNAPTRRPTSDVRYNGNPRPYFAALPYDPSRRISEDPRLSDNFRHFSPAHGQPRTPSFSNTGRPNSAPPRLQNPQGPQPLQPLQPPQQDILTALTNSPCRWESRPFFQLPLSAGAQRLFDRLMSTPATSCWGPFYPLNFSGCPFNPKWTAEIDAMMGGPEKPDEIDVEYKTSKVGQFISIGSTASLLPSLPAASSTDRKVLEQSEDNLLLANEGIHRQEKQQLSSSSRVIEEREDSLQLANESIHRQEKQQFFSSNRVLEDWKDSLPLAAVMQKKRKQVSDSDDEDEIRAKPIKKQRNSTSFKTLPTFSSAPSPSSLKARTLSSMEQPFPLTATPRLQSHSTKPQSSANSISKPEEPSKKKETWLPSEHDAIERELKALRADEEKRGLPRTQGLRDVRLWSYISNQLAAYGIIRTPSACKNYWSRFGRTISNWDERAIPNPNQLGTSFSENFDRFAIEI